MLKITAPRLVKTYGRMWTGWIVYPDKRMILQNALSMDYASRTYPKQNLSVNSCLFTNCGFIACNYRKSQFSDVVFKNL